jgi:fructose-1,6-bisphosphatase/inositol monophosphatase family enzyme
MTLPSADPGALLEPIVALHNRIRDAVMDACAAQPAGRLAAVDAEEAGDTIYGVDRVGEATLVEGLRDVARREPLVLVAEGLPLGVTVLPEGAREDDCRWRVLVDPIDGTRGLMYQKRSAWVLTGVAPNRGPNTRLKDIVLAVQTEIPLLKEHLCDQLHAIRGQGVRARRLNRLSGASEALTLRPSPAETIAHGFATVVRFFPGARDVLAAVDDELVRALLGTPQAGKAACFEDQYASTGGQLYELMAGHDRFIADLRPLVHGVLEARGLPRGLCCHPYDLCTALIAEELGVAITGADGGPLDAPFDVTSDVAWVGYANPRLRALVEPALRDVLRQHGLPAPASPA